MSGTPGPDFVIIGAMKAATSTLHRQLAGQPGFFMTTPKEPNFFSDDPVHARGLDWYRSLFAAAPPGTLRGESSTHYTKLPTHPHAAERLQDALGTGLKFVYVMRDPVERLVSHYIHEWSEGVIEDPIDLALERHPELLHYGCYAHQLEPWLVRFGPERILPVFFESLRARPQHELDRVGAFLGAPQPLRWLATRSRENVSSERMRMPPWANAIASNRPLLWMSQQVVPQTVRERIKSRWRLNERPRLSEESRLRAERVFDEDLERLGRWLGLALDCSGFAARAADAAPAWTAHAPGRA